MKRGAGSVEARRRQSQGVRKWVYMGENTEKTVINKSFFVLFECQTRTVKLLQRPSEKEKMVLDALVDTTTFCIMFRRVKMNTNLESKKKFMWPTRTYYSNSILVSCPCKKPNHSNP